MMLPVPRHESKGCTSCPLWFPTHAHSQSRSWKHLTTTEVHSSLKWKKTQPEKNINLHSLVLLYKMNWIFFSVSRGASVNNRCAKSTLWLGARWVGKGKDKTCLLISIKVLIWVSLSWFHALDCSYQTESKQYAKHKEQHQAEETHKNRAREANTDIQLTQ